MSIPNKTTISCPQCHTSFTTTIWDSVNTGLSHDLAKKVVDGTFFDARCPRCGFVAHLEYDLLYHDIERRAMIWVVHKNNISDYRKKVAEVRATASISGASLQTRIVHDMSELREKAAALLSGKDDRIIELCKVFIKYQAIGQNPDFKFRNAFYTFANGEDIIFVYDTDGNEAHCIIEEKVYQTVSDLFSAAMHKAPDSPFAIYDSNWANQFFEENFPEDTSEFLDDTSENDDTCTEVAEPQPQPMPQPQPQPPNLPEVSDSHEINLPDQTSWIKKNAFYFLRVSCNDSRRRINAAADELGFLLDESECESAKNTLLSPAKRLSAELDWFVDSEPEVVTSIRDCIDANLVIKIDNLPPLSSLNASLYNFSLSQNLDYLDVGYALLDIDEKFSSVNPEALVEVIGSKRSAAQMNMPTAQEVSFELGKKRERICKLISDRLSKLDAQHYVELATLIAEKCIAQDGYNDGIILADVIDQYEIRMQAEIESKANEIKAHIARIKQLIDEAAYDSNIQSLIRQVQQWDKLVQPIQLKSYASGVPHEASENIGYAVRGLVLFLNNEKSQAKIALMLVRAMQDVFAELGELANRFLEDAEVLERLVEENEISKVFLSDLESLQKMADKMKSGATLASVDGFCTTLKFIVAKINKSQISNDAKSQAREAIYYTGRGVAISLHNNNGQTKEALKIANVLCDEFNDLPSVAAKAIEDRDVLRKELNLKNAEIERKKAAKKSGIIGIVVLALVILFFVLLGQKTDNKPKNPYPSTTISTPAPVSRYSSSSTVGTEVYVDIISIFPEIGIYWEGDSNYTHFVCKCRTLSSATVWVYMPVSEYKSKFDSTVSTRTSGTATAEEITLASAKRLYGTVIKADSVISGLSSDINSVVVIELDAD